MFVFALSGMLYALDQFIPVPVKVNYLIFQLTNTPALFLAFLPAYFYIFRPTTALTE
ncbi:MAG: hypothetical protein H7Z75_13820 [Ferruginibacter sp.]|nr:hypothetical protein [Cytophagales bacterium]